MFLLSRCSSLYRIIFSGVQFPFSGFYEAAVDEDVDVAVYYCLRNAGALADAGDAVAWVAYDAGEDDSLDGVEAFDGADDAFVETDGQVAGKGGFFFARGRRITRIFIFARGRVFFWARR